jgi:hypothetical protein
MTTSFCERPRVSGAGNFTRQAEPVKKRISRGFARTLIDTFGRMPRIGLPHATVFRDCS